MSPAEAARPLARRAVLAASGTAVLAAAAACSSAVTSSGTTSAASSPTASSAASSAAPATSSRAASAATSAPAPDPSTGASAPDPGTPSDPTTQQAPAGPALASVADVQAAGSMVVGDAGNPYLLAYVDGTVVAHTAICTHQQCTVAAGGMCPCHGSRYDVSTGAVLGGPALQNLGELPVTVSAGQVYAG